MIHSSELILFDPNVHSLAPGVGLEHLNKESNMWSQVRRDGGKLRAMIYGLGLLKILQMMETIHHRPPNDRKLTQVLENLLGKCDILFDYGVVLVYI